MDAASKPNNMPKIDDEPVNTSKDSPVAVQDAVVGNVDANAKLAAKARKQQKKPNANLDKANNKSNHRDDDDAGSPETKAKKAKREINTKVKQDTAAIPDENADDDGEEMEAKQNGHSTNRKVSVDKTENNDDTRGVEDSAASSSTTAVASDDGVAHKKGFYSDDSFDSLPLSDKTKNALTTMKFTRMTRIQAQAIPALLMGKDVIGAAPTGSGKTLAFVVPIVELLHQASFATRNGTGAIIITPTRELALQIYGVVSELLTAAGPPTPTYGLVMGGANRRTEAEKLARGVAIVVCTPGRLLDHLQNTSGFVVRNLLALVMDEADRILEQGFEDDLRAILRLLPSNRQTLLFSATQTQNVQDLARLSIQPANSVYVHVPSGTPLATAEGLEQGYVTCPSDKRFLLLFTFLKKNKNKKIMVFFSSCNSVKFHSELLNYIDVPVQDIHGRQKQVKRTTTFFQFCQSSTGVLLCTDVAARGLDIPRVDWIIQFDPPDDPKEYIHRVGRTARGATGSGRALLFLTPEETGFLKYLRAAKVTLSEYEFPIHKVANVQSQLQRLLETNYYLNRAARDAYRSYLLSYASHAHRDIFNVHALDLQAVGAAFGFTSPPRVDIAFGNNSKSNMNSKGRRKDHVKGGDAGDAMKSKNKKHIAAASSGRSFSAENPYGKRQAGDKRQFSH